MNENDIRPGEVGLSGWEIIAKRAAEREAAEEDARFWRGVFGFAEPEPDNRFPSYGPWQ